MPKPVRSLSRNAREFLAEHERGDLITQYSQPYGYLWKILASRVLEDPTILNSSELKPIYLFEKTDTLDMYGQPTFRQIDCWIYKNRVYCIDDDFDYSQDQWMLLIHNEFDKERKQFEKMQANFTASSKIPIIRSKISSEVRIFVWQRDGGRCVDCGSNENLEYDHIIPLARGGSNTERNLQLLCGNCNRLKSDNIQ